MSEKPDIREEIEHFLDVLDGMVKNLSKASNFLKTSGGSLEFTHYHRFRTSISEALTFSTIIEGRLKKLKVKPTSTLLARLDDLVVQVWTIQLNGSLRYVDIITNLDYQPLGAREVFFSELRSMQAAEKALKDDRYQERLDDKVSRRLKTAAQILNEIITNAPQLLEFGK